MEAIGTNDSSISTGLAPISVASPAFGSIAGPMPGFATVPAPSSVNNIILGYVTVPTLGAITGHIVFVIMDPKTTFFYGKQVTAEDYTSSKLYMKKTIWIGGILFGRTIDA